MQYAPTHLFIMGYRNLQDCVADLIAHKQLLVVRDEVDPHLELSAVLRRVYQHNGPAVLFENVKGSSFPVLGNLFGTIDRTRFLFRDTLETVKTFFDLKVNPNEVLKNPSRLFRLPFSGLNVFPKKSTNGPVLYSETKLSKIPQVVAWPKDGGAFITLPQVYTENIEQPGFRFSNMGMYRVQLAGNNYLKDEEVGLHYQIHRGIGVHHTLAIKHNKPFRVAIFVGGSPAMTLSAVMPLPENLPEIYFAGVLAGHRIPMITRKDSLPLYAEADFCIVGTVIPNTLKEEGPFGDHLGYYSLKHSYPVLKVDHVYHRQNAIWPVTTVGRPPQEDTNFGAFIHELTGPVIPSVLPGVKEVHAVDASGVHPLLLAIGSERYTPYLEDKKPQEILTQANAILGQGQLSLAKYLFICDAADDADLKTHHVEDFILHCLERVDFARDLHFQTKTTIDTLDYSGEGLNEGSKVVMAVCGPVRRELSGTVPHIQWPENFTNPKVAARGILVIEGPRSTVSRQSDPMIERFVHQLQAQKKSLENFPLIVVVDDSDFCARHFDNFIWTTFTRSNPSVDVYGLDSFTQNKHWGCMGSLVIDARLKPQHAWPLEDDAQIEKNIGRFGLQGKELFGFI